MGNAPTKGQQQKNRGNKKYVHWDQAVPPWPPGKPHLVPGTPNTQPDVVTIRWDPPPEDGGAPITGYVVEHRKAGNPHWVRATTDLVLEPELRLSGLEPGWRYQFRVTAENAADLLSDPGELSQTLTVTRAYRPATMSPQFSLELRDTIALENDKAEFIVHFHGIPTPKIAWFKDSFEIFSSRRMRVTVENDVSSLLIHQTAFTDEGEYKCSATNRAGHIITKAKLRLEAPPRIRIPRQYEDGLIFEKDEVIRLKVSVAGRPLPRSTWYHNGEQIPFGGRYEVTNTDRSSGLRISEARRADRGEYQVRATSRLGEDITAFLVTVTDRPMPPGRANVVTSSGRSVTLSWTEPSDDGGCKIGNYIVEYYRLGWNVWLKAATCRHLTTTMGDLIEGSEYKFRVKAENPYGVSDPSVESDVVFIPDHKRGLLERPAGGAGGRTDIPLTEEPADKKREHNRSKDSLVGKDKDTRETEKKKESASKTGKATVDRNKLKSELMERLEERRSVIQHEMSDLTKRKNKENHEKRSVEPREYMPEIVKRQRRSTMAEMEVEDIPIQPPRPSESEKSLKASLQFSVAKRRGSSGEHDSGVSEGSFSEGKQSFTSPLLPREDDSLLLHGSSELMLVLLPETRNPLGERDPDRNSEFDIFGDSAVPPPMSLSAPELGSGEPLMIPPLRNAISSTELLHERAMARFYQAVAEEEAEKVRQRKEIMDRRSAEAEEVSRKPQAKLLEPPQELTWHQRKQRKLQDRHDSFENAPYNKRSSPQPEVNREKILNRKEPVKPPIEEEEYYRERASPQTDVNRKSTLNRKEPMRLDTDEEEEEEEEEEEACYTKRASLQPESNRKSTVSRKEPIKIFTEDEEEELFERIRKKTPKATEENKPGSIMRRREEEMTKTANKIEIEEGENEMDEEDEEDEEIEAEEEIEDEEYYENEELEEEESEEEVESEFDEEEELYKSMEEEEETYHPSSAVPRRIQMFAEEEEDTYHPRSMLPKASSTEARALERQHTPRPNSSGAVAPKSILKQNTRFQDELEKMVERRHGLLSRDLERSPPKSFRESLPKEFMPSFISDRRSHSPSPRRETESPEALQPEVEEEHEVKDVRNKRNKIFIAARKTAPEPDLPKPKPHTSPAKPAKPITRVTEPVVPTEEHTISAGESVLSAAEAARQKRMLIRKVSIEEDTEASKVVADYYGDIIRDHARPKKPIRRYLNTAEMKAAANTSPSHSSAPTPEPPASPTPEPEPEPEVTAQEQTVRIEQSAYDRYTAPVQSRPPTTRRKSRTPDLVLIRQSSKDRSRMPSTERFSSKQFPELTHRFSSEKNQPEKPENLLPVTSNQEQQLQVAERKWRSIFSYLADLAMFLVACWLYVFKDERLAIPVLVLMVYRQLHEAIKKRLPKLPQLPWKRSS